MVCHPQTGLAVAGELLGVDLAGGQHHRPRLPAASGAWPGGELVRSQFFSQSFTIRESQTLLVPLAELGVEWLSGSVVTKQGST